MSASVQVVVVAYLTIFFPTCGALYAHAHGMCVRVSYQVGALIFDRKFVLGVFFMYCILSLVPRHVRIVGVRAHLSVSRLS